MNYRKMTKSQLIEKMEELIKRNTELESSEGLQKPPVSGKEALQKSFLSPESNSGDLELADILDVAALKSLMKNFHKLVPITLAMVDLKGNVLVCEGWQDICTKYHRVHPESCRHCVESDTRLSAGVPIGGYKLYKCRNNMWDVATPIMAGGKHVGNFFSGQLFFDDEPIDYELFRSQARQYGFPEEEYMAALDAVPRLSRQSLDTVMAFFMRLAQLISQLSYSNLSLTRSLDERQALMTSLLAEEKKYKDIFENATMGIFRTTPAGRFLDANPVVARIFGYNSPEEIMARVTHVGSQLYVNPENREKWISIIDQQDFAGFETEMRKKDGSTCWVRQSARAVRNAAGKAIYYEGFSEDITEHKHTNEDLRKAEEKYRGIFDNALEGIYRSTPDGRFLDANPALAHIFGYDSPEDLMNTVHHVGKQLHIDPESRERFIAAMDQKDYASCEAQMRKKDGGTCWVRLVGRAVCSPEGKTDYYEGFCEDITERKRAEEELTQYRNHLEELVHERTSQLEEKNRLLIAEVVERKRMVEALRESENMYRTIFETTGNATVIFEEDTTISLVNTEFENLSHHSREATEGKKTLRDLVLEEDLEWLMGYHRRRRINPKEVPAKYELKAVDRDGLTHDVYMTVAMIPGTKKSVASLMDITHIKKTEEALARNEALYRNLFENASIGMFQVSYETGRFLRVNPAYATMLGYESPTNMMSTMGNAVTLHVDPKELAALLATLKQQDWFYGEYPRYRRDGTIMIGKVAIRRVLKPDGRIDYFEGIVEDVTEQRRAEVEVKKYVEEVRDLYENAPCGYHSLGVDGTILRMNDTGLSWLGYSRDEMIGKMKITDLLTPEGIDAFQRDFPLLKKQGFLRDIEDRWIRKDGSIFDVLVNVTAVFDENGNYLMNRCSVFDNTARKEAEDLIAENEALYRNLFENASIGMFQSTLEGKFIRINKAYATMLGYESPEEVISTITDTSTQIHADPGNRAELLAALEEQGWFYSEQPYLRKDGSIMIGQLAVRKVDRQDGSTAYLEGIVEDITERKRAEEALRKSERELRIKAQDLMEVNTTMRVLLETMEKDQEELKERFLANIKEQVLPYLDKLKKRPLQDVEKGFVKMAEAHLNEIASPFIQKLTSNYLNLTKTEIRVAALVKEGKTSKEIAEILNSTKRVIEFHRENIRKKLGLNNKKENLAILLRSFS